LLLLPGDEVYAQNPGAVERHGLPQNEVVLRRAGAPYLFPGCAGKNREKSMF
jgi:hypothetical protein